VKEEDFFNNNDADRQKIWQCFISNAILSVDAGGSDTKIIKSDEPDCQFNFSLAYALKVKSTKSLSAMHFSPYFCVS